MTTVTLVAAVTPTPLPATSTGAGVFRFAITPADGSAVLTQDSLTSTAIFDIGSVTGDFVASVARVDHDGVTLLTPLSTVPFSVAPVVVVPPPPVMFDAPGALTVTLS